MITPKATRTEIQQIAAIIFVAIACQVLAIMQAVRLNDAYWIAWGGAVIAGSAAFLVIVQIRRDVRLERLREVLTEKRAEMLAEIATKIGLVEARKEVSNLEKEINQGIYFHRRSTLILAATVAGVGEIIHGFGDLIGSFAGIGGAH